MNANELIDDLKKSVSSGLEVEPRTVNRFMIHTGFAYPDSYELHILMIKDGDDWMFSDEGHTMMWLSYEELDLTDSRKAFLDRVVETNGVSFTNGTLHTPIDVGDVDCIGLSLRRLIQAEIRIAVLLYLD